MYGTQVLGDEFNGVQNTSSTTGTIAWEHGVSWDFATAFSFFGGTWNEPAALAWDDSTTWTLLQLQQVQVRQELRVSANHSYSRFQTSERYNWYQDGVIQTAQYRAEGTQLKDFTTQIVAANYNESTGQLTFTNGVVWQRVGSFPRLPAQELHYQPGHSNSVLYLMMEGGCTGLNSRGPGYHSSTVAKLQLDPNSPVSHTETMRAHRFVEIPPGVLSQIRFFIRTAEGTPVDLWAQGASISFVCTIATRDGG